MFNDHSSFLQSVRELGRGLKWTALEKRSTTVRITVVPLVGGGSVTKSRAICDQAREGTGMEQTSGR